MSKTILIDGNFYVHRAFDTSVKRKSLDYIEKNTMTTFLQMVASDIVTNRGTHALVCFDAPGCFRYEVYKHYKASRRKSGPTQIVRDDGQTVQLDITAGSLIKSARKVIELAGITHAFVRGLEADDLIGSACVSLPGKKVICSRDKDLSVLVNDEVSIYWPTEKKTLGVAEVRKHWGVEPHQIRDYLCLLGDAVDNIPGVPGIGPKTARKILKEHGSISKALSDKKLRSLFEEHKETLVIAKKLVTLKTDYKFKLDNLVIDDVDTSLGELVWQIPKALKDLGEARKASKLKGLFG